MMPNWLCGILMILMLGTGFCIGHKPKGEPMTPQKSLAAMERDVERIARSINKLRNLSFQLGAIANDLNHSLRTFCSCIDGLKKKGG